MSNRKSGGWGVAWLAFSLSCFNSCLAGVVPFNGAPYVQSFDGLPVSGIYNGSTDGPYGLDDPGWSSPALVTSGLTGWQILDTVAGAETVDKAAGLNANYGNGAASAVLSYGADGSAERALGALAGSSRVMAFGVVLQNTSATPILELELTADVEQWRLGRSDGTSGTLTFAYAVGAGTDIATGSFVRVPALNAFTPVTTGTVGALNGNAAANRTTITARIALTWRPGEQLVLRWSDANDTGADHGLAIDNLTLTRVRSEEAPDASFVYKQVGEAGLELFVFKPAGWRASDTRPAIVFFYGGGWGSGDITRLMPYARHFATLGLVAVCADYRVKSRFGTGPEACVEDGKSAVRWLRGHAAELGIDPRRIVAAGDSAGGHVAASTAIVPGFEAAGEGTAISSAANALVLLNPVLDAVYEEERDGRVGSIELATAISPNHHLRPGLPPSFVLHGTADPRVPITQAQQFVAGMTAAGNRAELWSAAGGSHSFWTLEPWKTDVLPPIRAFLRSIGFLPEPVREAVLAEDGFADAERTEQRSPESLAWFASHASAVTVNAQGLRLDTAGEGSRQVAAHFPPQTLLLGQSLVVDFSFELEAASTAAPAAFHADEGGFRFGVFDSAERPLAADGDPSDNTFTGYAVFADLAPAGIDARPLTVRKRTGAAGSLLAAPTPAAETYALLGGGGGLGAPDFAADTTCRGTLVLTRTGAEELSISAEFTGGELSGHRVETADNGAVGFRFDTLAFALAGPAGQPAARALTLQRVRIATTFASGDLIEVRRSFPLPVIDLSTETSRHVIVAQGTATDYQGQPTTVLLPDGRTLYCVWSLGHGGTLGPLKRSDDGGRTWSPLLPVPDNWSTVSNCPVIYRLSDPEGVARLVVFGGLGSDAKRTMQVAYSENDGANWTAMASTGLAGTAMPFCTIEPIEGGRRLLGLTNIRRPGETVEEKSNVIAQSLSADGGLTWTPWRVILDLPGLKPCEPEIVRSPDGRQLLCLLRENVRRVSLYMTSDDEGVTWSAPRPLPRSLNGDRHKARYADDGRLVICFRDTGADSPTTTHFVAWVGYYGDLLESREGLYRVKLLHSYAGNDCGYPGLERLPDGTFVATTYVKYREGAELNSVVSTRFTLAEMDARWTAATPAGDYETYRQMAFSPADLIDTAVSGAAADANGDGASNLMAYALGYGPWSALVHPEPMLWDGALGLAFDRRRVAGVTYAVEVSDDLRSWQTDGSLTRETAALPRAPGFEHVIVTMNTPFTGIGARFLRLKVSR